MAKESRRNRGTAGDNGLVHLLEKGIERLNPSKYDILKSCWTGSIALFTVVSG